MSRQEHAGLLTKVVMAVYGLFHTYNTKVGKTRFAVCPGEAQTGQYRRDGPSRTPGGLGQLDS